MRLGDLLEWLAAVALVAAAYLWHHSLPLALLAAFVALVVLAQVYGATKLPAIELPKLHRKAKP